MKMSQEIQEIILLSLFSLPFTPTHTRTCAPAYGRVCV